MKKQKFLLVNVKDDSSYEYYSIDHTSGGYPYWSGSLSNAKIFSTSDEIRTMVETDPEFVRPTHFTNGEIYPPRMVHIASGLNNNKLHGYANLQIVEIKFELVKGFNLEAKIMKPKQTTYVELLSHFLRIK